MNHSSQDADEIGGDGQQGHHQHAGDDAGDHQVLHGVDRRDGEGVDLVGHPHGADLRADAGAAPGGQHDARQQRPQTAEKGEGHAGGDVVGGPEHGQDVDPLHGQDQAQGQGGHRHQGEGLHPQVVHLGDDLPEKPGWMRQGAAGLHEKQGQVAHVIHEAHDQMPGPVEEAVPHARPARPK